MENERTNRSSVSKNLRRVSLFVAIPLAVLVGERVLQGAVGQLKIWQDGEVLNAKDLNANFTHVTTGGALPPKTVINVYLSTIDASYFDTTGLGMSSGPYAGWALCNGKNGTPDLGNRFVRVNNGVSGATGGSDTLAHTHAIDHDHAAFASAAESAHTHPTPAHSHILPIGWDNSNSYWTGDSTGLPLYGSVVVTANRSPGGPVGSGFVSTLTRMASTDSSGAGTSGAGAAHAHTVDPPAFAGSSGPASATDNRPAYFELAAIMRL